MIKRSVLGVFTSLVIVSGLSVAPAAARDLTIVSWGGNYQDAQKEIYFDPFAKKVGKPVLTESWDGGIGVIAAKTQAGTPNWDVVQVESDELALGCFDGMYEPIDWTALGGKDKFIDAAVSDCGVGAIVWSTALSYDADKLKTAPTSWADFWDTKKFPGKRSLRRGPKYTLEFALMADGVAPKDVYDVLSKPEGVDRAFKKLDEIKSDLVWWESGAQPLQLLKSGQVVMTTAYNGRISAINKTEKTNFKVVWDGSIYAVDSWVILKGSPNSKEAMDFITFASEPDNQVKLPQYIAYGLPNKAAAAAVPADLQADLPTAPDNIKNALPLNVSFWTDNIEALTQRFDAWVAQ